MIETAAAIRSTLELIGTELEFVAGTIYGIPEQKLVDISDFGSPFEVIKNAYSFIVAASDLKELGVVEGSEFSILVFSRKFTFSAGTYTEDFNGWAKLLVTMLGVQDV